MSDLRSSGAQYAVGSHYGAHMHGLSRSNVRQIRLYINQPMARAMDSFNLVEAEDGNEALVLAHPIATSSVFEGAVEIDHVKVVDIVQCYLDVRSSSARGQEHAEHIFERILEPHFEVLGWR